ncbi:uncharacterized protein BKCO1_640002 [Diplodia corticola]|uniref:Uncharacterized protein n=1 Tax=Diplodia corticola TaxID=236234 RepID=A0A1J9RQR4_9PEZI|nr:uncharacterized protein BKCO1_640002 [Diplodia corticola]OJD30244.1 hypothetical protein BKCO1_640002 [Diplodia corticola]
MSFSHPATEPKDPQNSNGGHQPQQAQPKPSSEFSLRINRARANGIFERILRCSAGGRMDVPTAGTLSLRQSGYERLLQLLSKDTALEETAFQDLKMSYNRLRRQLSYEVPTNIRQDMTIALNQAITNQLNDIMAKSDAAKNLLDLVSVDRWPRSSVEIPGKKASMQRYPDGIWAIEPATESPSSDRMACFIFEMCFMPGSAAAEGKVLEVMLKRHGCPGMALIINMRHTNPEMRLNPPADMNSKASYALYEWIAVEDEDGSVEGRVVRVGMPRAFRNSSGGLVPGKLSFTVADFLGRAVEDHIPSMDDEAFWSVLEETIEIDHSDMLKWLEQAESWELKLAQDPAMGGTIKKKDRKPVEIPSENTNESPFDSGDLLRRIREIRSNLGLEPWKGPDAVLEEESEEADADSVST